MRFVVTETAVDEAACIVTQVFEISDTHTGFYPSAVMADGWQDLGWDPGD